MLHRITGRATKCGPSAISAIAGVPTHEAAAVIRRLFDRPSVNGVAHRRTRRRPRGARLRSRLRDPPSEIPRSPPCAPRGGLGAHLPRTSRSRCAPSRSGPSSTPRRPAHGRSRRAVISWPMPTASSRTPAPGFSRKPVFWFRPIPDHDRVALRRVREAVRFVPISQAQARTGRELNHAEDRRDHGLHHRRAFRRREGERPQSGTARPACTTSGTISSTTTSRRSAGSSA